MSSYLVQNIAGRDCPLLSPLSFHNPSHHCDHSYISVYVVCVCVCAFPPTFLLHTHGVHRLTFCFRVSPALDMHCTGAHSLHHPLEAGFKLRRPCALWCSAIGGQRVKGQASVRIAPPFPFPSPNPALNLAISPPSHENTQAVV